MNNPILWLCLSFLLLSVSLTAVFVVLVPAVVEMSRAARSFERLCNTLDRDLPPTLESLRQTTDEITRLTDDVNAGVKNAGRVAQQVDQSVTTARTQAKQAQINTRSLMAGLSAAWTTFKQPDERRDRPRPAPKPNSTHTPMPRPGGASSPITATANEQPTESSTVSEPRAASDAQVGHSIRSSEVGESDRPDADSMDDDATAHDAASQTHRS